MHHLARALFALAAFAAATSSAAAQEGRYRVAGKNADGSPYSGVAQIVVTSRNTCRIEWNTGSTSSGICMRRGNTLSAAYVLGQKAGLIIYEIKDNGAMEGIWTVADQSGVGLEVLTPMR